jgi:uncharacterized protein
VIVVSDTSPIRALHHIGLLSLCQELYGSTIVPEAVRAELQLPTTTCPAINITQFVGFEVRSPHAAPAAFNVPSDLDPGETQAITLALELRADLLLMDERKGTEAARNLKLSTIGVMGVLLEAKRRGKIQRVLPLVDRLVAELKFFITPALRRRMAELANE